MNHNIHQYCQEVFLRIGLFITDAHLMMTGTHGIYLLCVPEKTGERGNELPYLNTCPLYLQFDF